MGLNQDVILKKVLNPASTARQSFSNTTVLEYMSNPWAIYPVFSVYFSIKDVIIGTR
jgi:hypothetical protein